MQTKQSGQGENSPASGNTLEQLAFDNRYARLPEEFWHAVGPQPLLENHLISFSDQVAGLIGLDPEEARRADFIDYFTGSKTLPGTEPLARASLDNYWPQYDAAYQAVARAKLGLCQEQKGDQILWLDLLDLLEGQVDYTRFFRGLCQFNALAVEAGDNSENSVLRDQFIDRAAFDAWAVRYCARLQQEPGDDRARCQRMQGVNPKYILRNYLAEQAIRKAEDEGDYSEIECLLQVLRTPCDEQPGFEAYAAAPPDWAGSISVSCSS
jgi:uncharacterized protein YdiU (UPF0061 family)